MKIIAIVNQKGGVGKTTTTVNLAAGLKKAGKRVLTLDFDPQCNLSKYFGYKADGGPTITDYLFAKATYQPLPDTAGCIRSSDCGIDFIPASLSLAKSELIFAQAMFRERILRDVLEQIVPAENYDYLLIDCGRSMGVLLTNVLCAVNAVLIPVQTEDFAVDGLADMLELIDLVRGNINPTLKVLGFLPTLTTRTKGSREILSWLRTEHPEHTFAVEIPRLAEAPKSVKAHKPMVGGKGILGKQYEEAAAEVLWRMEDE